MTIASKTRQAECLETLRENIQPGMTVHTIVTHVARSGMQRSIRLFIIRDGQPWDISWLAAHAMNDRIDDKNGGIKISGCGSDMGFELTYNLGRVLFPDGFGCIGRDDAAHIYCHSNDHSNGDRDFTPHTQEDGIVYGLGHWHRDGGYALNHHWL